MIKPITGAWIEFQHHNKAEGKYWNPICRHFSKEQWKEKVAEMASIGIEYAALLCTSLVYSDYEESYFKTDIYPFAPNFGCDDPIGALLEAGDEYGVKFFLSVGYYGDWYKPYVNMSDPVITKRAFQAMGELHELYKHHESYYGWYYPDESGIVNYFDDEFYAYINKYSAFIHTLDKTKKTFIAPYGTNMITADDKYVGQLEKLDVDFIAYQDEVGVHKSTPDQTKFYYEALKKAHDKAQRIPLWANVEMFDFEGEVYHSGLIPTTIERLEKQIEAVSPFCEKVFSYEYIGMMNKPGTTAFCGHPDSVKLYCDYMDMLKRHNVI